MTRAKLVDNISKLVMSIEDENLLQSLYEMLRQHKSAKPGELWNSLTQDQKDEVLKAYDELHNIKPSRGRSTSKS